MTLKTVLEAASIGLLVPPVLTRHERAAVLAAFERSFYLEAGRDLITVGAASLHDGPLNIRLGTTENTAFTTDLGVTPGQRWTIGPHRLQPEEGPIIQLETASIWQPAAPAGAVAFDRLTQGLGHLRRRLAEVPLPEGSLIRLVLDGSTPENPVERAAAPLLQHLFQALSSGFAGSSTVDVEPAIGLLGLGPGLTPAGDDLLAGLLIACSKLGERHVARRLGDALLYAAPERTTCISLAHLTAAAAGYGAAPLHDLLDGLVRSERAEMDRALDAAAKIGHSSGFDAVGGIILALRAWLDAVQPG